MEYIVGIDEVGRGPWAGPVVAGAVILDPQNPIEGLDDSKKLTVKKRETLALEIKAKALAWGIGQGAAHEIDTLNIVKATFLAMQRAVAVLSITPHLALIDGHMLPLLDIPAKGIVKGDSLEPCISAASIIAKVERDNEMIKLDAKYPGYGFASHKGYGTKLHQESLKNLGVSDIHRKSFKPIAELNIDAELHLA